jgi:hypothetical protein
MVFGTTNSKAAFLQGPLQPLYRDNRIFLFQINLPLHEQIHISCRKTAFPFPFSLKLHILEKLLKDDQLAVGKPVKSPLAYAYSSKTRRDSGEMAQPGKVILAGTIAKGLLAEVAEGLSKLSIKPKLVGFLANEDPAAKVYADYSAKTCVEKYV